MISATVENFRGIAAASIECAPVALVAGLNAAGKSSLAQAIAAALTGEVLPFEGLGRGGASALVRVGTSAGRAQLTGPDGVTRVVWPEGRMTSDGKPPGATMFAAGLLSLTELALRERARVLAELLHADPDRDDLAAALAVAQFDPAAVDPIWQLIEDHGWDTAHLKRRDRGAELKGQWRQVTGATYGSRVGAAWRSDLDAGDKELTEAQAAVLRARQDQQNAIAAAAVSADEKRRLEEEAAELDARQGVFGRAEARVGELTRAYDAAVAERQKLPPAGAQQRSMACPYCGEPIIINQVSLVETRIEKATAPTGGDPGALKARREAIASADGAVAHANDELMQARAMVTRARALVEQAEQAQQRLDAWPTAVEAGTDERAAAQRVAQTEAHLALLKQKHDADDIHRRIETNERVIELLAPDGLRAKKLARVIEAFVETQLRPLSEAAGWQAIGIDTDTHITYGGRPYPLLSSSEQYRVRSTLQLAMASIDGSAMVVLDGADILDAPSRPGLFAMIDKTQTHALVCMTLPRREMVPDLAQWGMGRSYWLAGGSVEVVASPAGKAA